MTVTYTNSNSIADGGDFLVDPDKVVVGPDAFVYNVTGGAFYDLALIFFFGSYDVTINGIVGSFLNDGLEFNDSVGNSKLTVGETGEVFGLGDGVSAYHSTSITNSGFIGGADNGIYHAANGNYTITNNASGTIAVYPTGTDGMQLTGGGVHTIVNKGEIYGSDNWYAIEGFAGVERLTNSGWIGGDVLLGDGNDTFLQTGKGFVDGDIYMGEGNDAFTGGNSSEYVWDQGGRDTYKLGGGNDVFFATGAIGSGDDGSTDTVDGGTGDRDVYDASNATDFVNINLDVIAHNDPFYGEIAARTANGDDIGRDIISNFEDANGGTDDDLIFGNKLSNRIWGNDGEDNLWGFAGNDWIDGGADSDFILGGAGKDRLYGGGADGAFDKFIYSSVKDSAHGASNRDIIFDFEDDFDVVDLSAIGSLQFTGKDVKFSGLSGEVRVMTTGAGWRVQVDTNGDTKVDMAIEVYDLAHAISWDETDFDFIA